VQSKTRVQGGGRGYALFYTQGDPGADAKRWWDRIH
jgi:hypothetical protein